MVLPKCYAGHRKMEIHALTSAFADMSNSTFCLSTSPPPQGRSAGVLEGDGDQGPVCRRPCACTRHQHRCSHTQEGPPQENRLCSADAPADTGADAAVALPGTHLPQERVPVWTISRSTSSLKCTRFTKYTV